MIQKSTTMLYVNDTKAALAFWTEKIGFVLLNQVNHEESISYEIAPSQESEIKFGIHDKNWVAKKTPEMNFSFPSLLFETDDLEAEYQRLTLQGVATNPIMTFGGMLHFTFKDNEGNYIAVKKTDKP